MSDRLYVPGVSAPAVFGRTERRTMLAKLGPGISYGHRTPENPLGLYEPLRCIEGDSYTTPVPYLAPYTRPNQRFIWRNDIYRASFEDPGDPFGCVAGLVHGGIIAYAHYRPGTFSAAERVAVDDNQMLSFGARIAMLLQREIARELIAIDPAISTQEVYRITRASYLSTVGKLIRCENDVAVAIEAGLGIASGDSLTIDPIPATVRVQTILREVDGPAKFKNIITHAELEIDSEEEYLGSTPKCGGEYMQYNGSSLTRALWNRTNRLMKQIPWLLTTLREEAGESQ